MKWIKIHAIKTKLLIGFSVIMFLMFGLLYLLNHLLLDNYFLYVNEKNMVDSTKRYGYTSQGNLDYHEMFGSVSLRNGGQVLIYNEDGSIFMGEVPIENKQHMTGPDLSFLMKKADEDLEDGFIEVIDGDLVIGKRLVYIRKMVDGRYVMISKGLGIIDEAKKMFVGFLGLSSGLVYLVGFVLIYFYADNFTKPILHLKKAAEKMAALNFEGQLEVTSEDEIGGLVLSVNDMASALSNSIAELNASNLLLEKELNKEKNLENMRRRFVTDVSHELKNPISMIIGYADGIERGIPKTPDDLLFYSRVIKEEGKRMNSLVRDLLDISSYTSGTFKMNKIQLDISELIRSTMNRYKKLADEKEVTLVMDNLPATMITGDLTRLEQVMTNLLDNALKHVDKAGLVMAYVDKVGHRSKIVIANTGPLIPEEEFQAIWESFYQIDTDSHGNGLGLTIVKSIVEMHGGSIRVYVTKGMNHFEIIL